MLPNRKSTLTGNLIRFRCYQLGSCEKVSIIPFQVSELQVQVFDSCLQASHFWMSYCTLAACSCKYQVLWLCKFRGLEPIVWWNYEIKYSKTQNSDLFSTQIVLSCYLLNFPPSKENWSQFKMSFSYLGNFYLRLPTKVRWIPWQIREGFESPDLSLSSLSN